MNARWMFVLGMLAAMPAAASETAGEEGAEATTEADVVEAEEAGAPTLTYVLKPKESWLYVVVYNDPSTIGSALGHDHAIVASDFDGKVTWNADDPSACQVAISFPVTALVVDPPGARERAQLDPGGAVGDSSKRTIVGNFLGKRQLYADQFPQIGYRSTSCDGGRGKVRVKGELTIRGATKPVELTMDVSPEAGRFAAKGLFTLRHADFGFDPFSNMMGALRNKDEMKFVVDVVGHPE